MLSTTTLLILTFETSMFFLGAIFVFLLILIFILYLVFPIRRIDDI